MSRSKWCMAASRCKVHAKQVSSKVAKNAKATHTTLEALDKEATREILGEQHKEDRYKGNEHENIVFYNYARGTCSATEYGTLKEAVEKALEDHGIGKVRKDAVVAENMYYSAPDWRDYTEAEQQVLIGDVRAEAESRGLTVVDIRLHMDEATPHVHVTSVPIVWDDDRQRYKLAATKLMAYTTAEATAWQQKVWEQIAKPRGYKKPDLGKSSAKGYVKKTSQEAAEVRAEANAAKEELAEINRRLEVARLLEQSVAECPDRLDRVCELTRERGQAAAERAKVAAASQAKLGAEIAELRERVAEAERERDAARDRERAARTRFGDLADQARAVLMELGRLPQRFFNRLCESTRQLAHKLGLDPTLSGFADFGRRVAVSAPSAYEQRRERGVLATLLDREPRKPGELKSAKDKPRQLVQETETPDKLNKLAAATARAQALDKSRRGRGGHSVRSAER